MASATMVPHPQQPSFGPGSLHEARSVVRSTVALAIVTGLTMLAPFSAHGQDDGGSTAAAFGGAAVLDLGLILTFLPIIHLQQFIS